MIHQPDLFSSEPSAQPPVEAFDPHAIGDQVAAANEAAGRVVDYAYRPSDAAVDQGHAAEVVEAEEVTPQRLALGQLPYNVQTAIERSRAAGPQRDNAGRHATATYVKGRIK